MPQAIKNIRCIRILNFLATGGANQGSMVLFLAQEHPLSAARANLKVCHSVSAIDFVQIGIRKDPVSNQGNKVHGVHIRQFLGIAENGECDGKSQKVGMPSLLALPPYSAVSQPKNSSSVVDFTCSLPFSSR